MSYDVFFQSLPKDITSISEIPDGFQPEPLGRLEEIRASIELVMPGVSFDESGWGTFETEDFSIEVSLGDEDPVRGFVLHVRGSEDAQVFVDQLIRVLDCPAIDPQMDVEIRRAGDRSDDAHRKWQAYRDKVVGEG